MSIYHSFNKLTISFDTGPIPPPFCHRYTIDISKIEEGLAVSLSLEYYDRDELTEEEIFDEGFSGEDDFKWEGELTSLWADELKSKLSTTNWSKKANSDDGSSLFVKISEARKSELLYPADKRVWEVFAQDIIQAIFELAEKEAPLQIEFLSVGQKNQMEGLSLTYSFSQRLVEVRTTSNKSSTIDWKEGQKLMQYIYFFDFLPEDANETISNIQGEYISPGDGMWYEIKDDKDGRLVDRKQKLIRTLKSYF